MSLLPYGRGASFVLGREVLAPGLCSSGMFLSPLQSGSPSQWRQPLPYIPPTREQPQSISGVLPAPSSCGTQLREQQCEDRTSHSSPTIPSPQASGVPPPSHAIATAFTAGRGWVRMLDNGSSRLREPSPAAHADNRAQDVSPRIHTVNSARSRVISCPLGTHSHACPQVDKGEQSLARFLVWPCHQGAPWDLISQRWR